MTTSKKETAKPKTSATKPDAKVKPAEKPETPKLFSKPVKLGKVPIIGATGVVALLLAGGVGYLASARMNNASTELASLRSEFTTYQTEMDQKLSALQAAQNTGNSEQLIALKTDLNGQIEALRDQISAIDSVPVESRLATLEAELAKIDGSLTSLTGQLGALAEGDVTAVSVEGAEIDGLRNAMADISSRLGGMDQQIDQLKAQTDRRIGEAEQELVTATSSTKEALDRLEIARIIADIERAVENGVPFQTYTQRLTAAGIKVPTPLRQHAESGVATMAFLKSEFPEAAHSGLSASIQAEGRKEGGNRILSFFKSQVTVRSTEPKQGDTTDAILSRVGAAVDSNDLPVAVQTANQLSDAAQFGMIDWLAALRKRNGVVSALKEFSKGYQE